MLFVRYLYASQIDAVRIKVLSRSNTMSIAVLNKSGVHKPLLYHLQFADSYYMCIQQLVLRIIYGMHG